MDRYHSKKIKDFAKTRRAKRVARLYPKTEPISEPSFEIEMILKYPFGSFVTAIKAPPSAENMAFLRRAARAMWIRPSCPKDANDDFGLFRNWSLGILTRCIENNRLDVLRMLVLEENINVNASNSTGWTALHAASLAGMTDMVAFLVANGALLENMGTEDSVMDIPLTPLFAAALGNKVPTFKFLLEAGAKVALSSADFPSAINYTQSSEIVAIALSHGAGVNVDSKEANKPTDCIHGKVQAPLLVFPEQDCLISAGRAAQFFIDQGADVDAEDWEGTTALHKYVSISSYRKLLLGEGAKGNIDNRTPSPSWWHGASPRDGNDYHDLESGDDSDSDSDDTDSDDSNDDDDDSDDY